MNSKQLNELSHRDEWIGKLQVEHTNTRQETKYVLYATGNCDINGRNYVALPKNLKISDDVKQKYNLL